MNLEQKKEYVAELSTRLNNASLVALADYRGTSVAQITAIRAKFRDAGMGYEVIKNTLTRRATAGTAMEGLDKHLTGMTGVITSGEDGIAAAKLLKELTKQFETFKLKGGYFEGEVLDGEGVAKVADLPSKEQLQAQLLATLLESPRRVLRVLQAPARDLLYLLKNYERKLEEQAGQSA